VGANVRPCEGLPSEGLLSVKAWSSFPKQYQSRAAGRPLISYPVYHKTKSPKTSYLHIQWGSRIVSPEGKAQSVWESGEGCAIILGESLRLGRVRAGVVGITTCRKCKHTTHVITIPMAYRKYIDVLKCVPMCSYVCQCVLMCAYVVQCVQMCSNVCPCVPLWSDVF
jgi:hypothetical protein